MMHSRRRSSRITDRDSGDLRSALMWFEVTLGASLRIAGLGKIMRYVTHSVFRIVNADADEMTEHYARTLSPAKVEPLQRGALISVEDQHYAVGRCSVWNGRCHSGMKVTLGVATAQRAGPRGKAESGPAADA